VSSNWLGNIKASESLKVQQHDKWLQQWEKTYTDAKLLELPEVYEERTLYDFLTAIRAVAPDFAGILEILLEEKIAEAETLPTGYDIIEDYRYHFTPQSSYYESLFPYSVRHVSE
jgi:hypothetical protein